MVLRRLGGLSASLEDCARFVLVSGGAWDDFVDEFLTFFPPKSESSVSEVYLTGALARADRRPVIVMMWLKRRKTKGC